MTLSLLKKYDGKCLLDINRLISELSSSAPHLSSGSFQKIVKDRNTFVFILRDKDKIVGMGTLVLILTPVGFRARIEDVVIDEKYRGRGLGTMLSRRLIAEAKRRKARRIELTSRQSRAAANRLYRKLGFKKIDTNVYRLVF